MTLIERYRTFQLCWKLSREIDPIVRDRTKTLMDNLDKQSHSGEWKRHQVYAQLIKEFPQKSRKSIALTIEVVKCCG